MLSSPPQRTNISLRSPETIKPHHAQKIEVIYNSLREHKLELKEQAQYIDIYTPDILLRILDAKVIKYALCFEVKRIGRTSS